MVFLPAVSLTGAGATAAEELVSRLYVTKTGPPPAPTVDVFCTVRATHSAELNSRVLYRVYGGIIVARNRDVRVRVTNCVGDEGKDVREGNVGRGDT